MKKYLLIIIAIIITLSFLSCSNGQASQETSNQPPIADAGEDKECFSGEVVTLDGSSSSDTDGDQLTYVWEVEGEKYSEKIIAFRVGDQGRYIAILTVSDGEFTSEDTIRITVNEATSETTTKAVETTADKTTSEETVAVQESETTAATTTETTEAIPIGTLKVHFINVGQGDSVLIQTPEGNTMLIDGGPRESGPSLVAYLKNRVLLG